MKESPRVVTVVRTEGFVDVKYGAGGISTALKTGDRVGPGDLIQTDDTGTAELMLADKSVIKIGPLSRVLIKQADTIEVTKTTRSTFELLKGKIRAVVTPLINRESSFTIKTNNATVGVRGTDFGITYDSDLDSTYVLGLSGCVVVDTGFGRAESYNLCGGKEILIVKGDTPKGPTNANNKDVQKFLEEMKITDDAAGGSEAVSRPFIAEIFLNRTIDLRDIEGTLSVSGDTLTINHTIIISGTAIDEKSKVISVSVSLDGGLTWDNAIGTNKWSYEFVPAAYGEYELLVKAINERGIESDPRDLDPIKITFRDIGSQDIVREFIGTFVDGLRNEDISAIRDIVSDGYDGSVGGFFSKDELIEEGIRDTISIMGSTTISYTIDQVSIIGDRIVGSTGWTTSIMGKKESGTTKWWLSAGDSYSLIHSEGDWFLAGINSDTIVLPEGIILEEIDSGVSYPCHKAVKIYVTAPNVPAGVTSILVGIGTYVPASWNDVTLTRSYYEDYTGIPVGFGGEVVLQYEDPPTPPPTLFCSFAGFSDPPYDYVNCSYNGYGYSFYVTETLLP